MWAVSGSWKSFNKRNESQLHSILHKRRYWLATCGLVRWQINTKLYFISFQINLAMTGSFMSVWLVKEAKAAADNSEERFNLRHRWHQWVRASVTKLWCPRGPVWDVTPTPAPPADPRQLHQRVRGPGELPLRADQPPVTGGLQEGRGPGDHHHSVKLNPSPES